MDLSLHSCRWCPPSSPPSLLLFLPRDPSTLPRAPHCVGAGQAKGRCGTAGSHPEGGGGTEGAAHLAGGEAHADSVVPSRQRDLRRLPPPLLRRRWTRWRALRHKHSTSLGHAGQDHLPQALFGIKVVMSTDFLFSSYVTYPRI